MRWLLMLLLAGPLYAQDSVPPGRVQDFASRFTTQSALVDWSGATEELGDSSIVLVDDNRIAVDVRAHR